MDALLLRKSFAEISVADLAAKAKVAQATIYQRFSNADATASVLYGALLPACRGVGTA